MVGSSYWQADADLTLLLETLNIVCLIPAMNFRALKIKDTPAFASGSYEEALWVNCLPALLHGEHHWEVETKIGTISK